MLMIRNLSCCLSREFC